MRFVLAMRLHGARQMRVFKKAAAVSESIFRPVEGTYNEYVWLVCGVQT